MTDHPLLVVKQERPRNPGALCVTLQNATDSLARGLDVDVWHVGRVLGDGGICKHLEQRVRVIELEWQKAQAPGPKRR